MKRFIPEFVHKEILSAVKHNSAINYIYIAILYSILIIGIIFYSEKEKSTIPYFGIITGIILFVNYICIIEKCNLKHSSYKSFIYNFRLLIGAPVIWGLAYILNDLNPYIHINLFLNDISIIMTIIGYGYIPSMVESKEKQPPKQCVLTDIVVLKPDSDAVCGGGVADNKNQKESTNISKNMLMHKDTYEIRVIFYIFILIGCSFLIVLPIIIPDNKVITLLFVIHFVIATACQLTTIRLRDYPILALMHGFGGLLYCICIIFNIVYSFYNISIFNKIVWLSNIHSLLLIIYPSIILSQFLFNSQQKYISD